jgi:hypothetical protein
LSRFNWNRISRCVWFSASFRFGIFILFYGLCRKWFLLHFWFSNPLLLGRFCLFDLLRWHLIVWSYWFFRFLKIFLFHLLDWFLLLFATFGGFDIFLGIYEFRWDCLFLCLRLPTPFRFFNNYLWYGRSRLLSWRLRLSLSWLLYLFGFGHSLLVLIFCT